ncbi:MAG TPA: hypothetical protein VGI79_23355 [Caulobacteraceae bacterium]|jgi:hypothetical protein
MSHFSPTEAATEGLRLTRLRSRAVVIWGLAYFGFTILLGRLAELTLGPHSAELLAELQRVKSDSDAFWPMAGRMWPFFAAGVPVNLVFQAIFTCAVYRAVLDPANARNGYMRLGADEVRMVGLNLLISLIWTAALFVVALVALLIGTTVGVIGSPFVALLGDAVILASVAVVIWILVRLSLAGAITFSERRVQVFKSWELTKGRFWPLCWAYVMAFLLWLALVVMMEIAKTVIQVGVHLSGLNLADYGAWAGPVIFLLGLFSSAGAAVVLTCFTVILTAPSAEAYRELIEP